MIWTLGAAAAFLPDNSLLETRSKEVGGRRLTGLRVQLGRGEERAPGAIVLLLDAGEEQTLIGDAETAGWGVPCRSPAENACVVADAAQRVAFYDRRRYSYREAIIHARIAPRARLPPSAPKLAFRLVAEGEPWALGDWGVAGLAPRSALGEYLRRVAGRDVSLGLRLESQGAAEPGFDAFVIYNPPTAGRALFVRGLAAEERFWTLNGDLLLPGAELDLRNRTFCLSIRAEELLLLADPADFCRRVRALACGAGACNSTTADLARLPQLSLTFGNSTFAFAPADYAFLDAAEQLQCRVGELRGARAAGQCPLAAHFALGRAFLARYPPVLTFRRDGGARLALLDELPLPLAPSGYLWAALGLLVALAALSAALVVALRRRAPAREGYAAG